jgi:hypothetical protein
MSEHDPTEKEREEAEALARALEGDGTPGDIPDDALEAAALLRRSREGGDLDPGRQRAILEKVLPDEPPARRSGWLRWLVPVGSAAALALVVALWTSTSFESRAPAQGAALPRPSARLLRAQASAASGDARELASLAGEMNVYRRDLYAVLADRYQG